MERPRDAPGPSIADVFGVMAAIIVASPCEFNSDEKHRQWLSGCVVRLRARLLQHFMEMVNFYKNQNQIKPKWMSSGELLCLSGEFDDRFSPKQLRDGIREQLRKWGFAECKVSEVSYAFLVELPISAIDVAWAIRITETLRSEKERLLVTTSAANERGEEDGEEDDEEGSGEDASSEDDDDGSEEQKSDKEEIIEEHKSSEEKSSEDGTTNITKSKLYEVLIGDESDTDKASKTVCPCIIS